jgi:alkanesulfonate monooxygenase SsuD/methylene tetrahydromethanopterin reductase-like flavin-dependent oxidoreductase (luciferase family)
VIAGVNVVAADTMEAARENYQAVRRNLAINLFARGQALGDDQAEQLLAQSAGHHVDQMLTYTATGTPAEVGDYLDRFKKQADADELITAHQAPTTEARLRSVTLTAEAMDTVSI